MSSKERVEKVIENNQEYFTFCLIPSKENEVFSFGDLSREIGDNPSRFVELTLQDALEYGRSEKVSEFEEYEKVLKQLKKNDKDESLLKIKKELTSKLYLKKISAIVEQKKVLLKEQRGVLEEEAKVEYEKAIESMNKEKERREQEMKRIRARMRSTKSISSSRRGSRPGTPSSGENSLRTPDTGISLPKYPELKHPVMRKIPEIQPPYAYVHLLECPENLTEVEEYFFDGGINMNAIFEVQTRKTRGPSIRKELDYYVSTTKKKKSGRKSDRANRGGGGGKKKKKPKVVGSISEEKMKLYSSLIENQEVSAKENICSPHRWITTGVLEFLEYEYDETNKIYNDGGDLSIETKRLLKTLEEWIVSYTKLYTEFDSSDMYYPQRYIPEPLASDDPNISRGYYDMLMSHVPKPHEDSVPIILNCMIEQVLKDLELEAEEEERKAKEEEERVKREEMEKMQEEEEEEERKKKMKKTLPKKTSSRKKTKSSTPSSTLKSKKEEEEGEKEEKKVEIDEDELYRIKMLREKEEKAISDVFSDLTRVRFETADEQKINQEFSKFSASTSTSTDPKETKKKRFEFIPYHDTFEKRDVTRRQHTNITNTPTTSEEKYGEMNCLPFNPKKVEIEMLSLLCPLSVPDKSLCPHPSSTPPLKVILAGPAASGKGTQCELIAETFGLQHLSTGDMLRAAVKNQTELGKQAKEYMDTGRLVPDALVLEIVRAALQSSQCSENGWLLDGFPRSEKQAEFLKRENLMPDIVISLEVPSEELVKRVVGRRMDPETKKIYHLEFSPPPDDEEVLSRLIQRSDDTEEKLMVRLEAYNQVKHKLATFFSESIVQVDGNAYKHEIFKKISSLLNSTQTNKKARLERMRKEWKMENSLVFDFSQLYKSLGKDEKTQRYDMTESEVTRTLDISKIAEITSSQTNKKQDKNYILDLINSRTFSEEALSYPEFIQSIINQRYFSSTPDTLTSEYVSETNTLYLSQSYNVPRNRMKMVSSLTDFSSQPTFTELFRDKTQDVLTKLGEAWEAQKSAFFSQLEIARRKREEEEERSKEQQKQKKKAKAGSKQGTKRAKSRGGGKKRAKTPKKTVTPKNIPKEEENTVRTIDELNISEIPPISGLPTTNEVEEEESELNKAEEEAEAEEKEKEKEEIEGEEEEEEMEENIEFPDSSDEEKEKKQDLGYEYEDKRKEIWETLERTLIAPNKSERYTFEGEKSQFFEDRNHLYMYGGGRVTYTRNFYDTELPSSLTPGLSQSDIHALSLSQEKSGGVGYFASISGYQDGIQFGMQRRRYCEGFGGMSKLEMMFHLSDSESRTRDFFFCFWDVDCTYLSYETKKVLGGPDDVASYLSEMAEYNSKMAERKRRAEDEEKKKDRKTKKVVGGANSGGRSGRSGRKSKRKKKVEDEEIVEEELIEPKLRYLDASNSSIFPPGDDTIGSLNFNFSDGTYIRHLSSGVISQGYVNNNTTTEEETKKDDIDESTSTSLFDGLVGAGFKYLKGNKGLSSLFEKLEYIDYENTRKLLIWNEEQQIPQEHRVPKDFGGIRRTVSYSSNVSDIYVMYTYPDSSLELLFADGSIMCRGPPSISHSKWMHVDFEGHMSVRYGHKIEDPRDILHKLYSPSPIPAPPSEKVDTSPLTTDIASEDDKILPSESETSLLSDKSEKSEKSEKSDNKEKDKPKKKNLKRPSRQKSKALKKKVGKKEKEEEEETEGEGETEEQKQRKRELNHKKLETSLRKIEVLQRSYRLCKTHDPFSGARYMSREDGVLIVLFPSSQQKEEKSEKNSIINSICRFSDGSNFVLSSNSTHLKIFHRDFHLVFIDTGKTLLGLNSTRNAFTCTLSLSQGTYRVHKHGHEILIKPNSSVSVTPHSSHFDERVKLAKGMGENYGCYNFSVDARDGIMLRALDQMGHYYKIRQDGSMKITFKSKRVLKKLKNNSKNNKTVNMIGSKERKKLVLFRSPYPGETESEMFSKSYCPRLFSFCFSDGTGREYLCPSQIRGFLRFHSSWIQEDRRSDAHPILPVIFQYPISSIPSSSSRHYTNEELQYYASLVPGGLKYSYFGVSPSLDDIESVPSVSNLLCLPSSESRIVTRTLLKFEKKIGIDRLTQFLRDFGGFRRYCINREEVAEEMGHLNSHRRSIILQNITDNNESETSETGFDDGFGISEYLRNEKQIVSELEDILMEKEERWFREWKSNEMARNDAILGKTKQKLSSKSSSSTNTSTSQSKPSSRINHMSSHHHIQQLARRKKQSMEPRRIHEKFVTTSEKSMGQNKFKLAKRPSELLFRILEGREFGSSQTTPKSSNRKNQDVFGSMEEDEEDVEFVPDSEGLRRKYNITRSYIDNMRKIDSFVSTPRSRTQSNTGSVSGTGTRKKRRSTKKSKTKNRGTGKKKRRKKKSKKTPKPKQETGSFEYSNDEAMIDNEEPMDEDDSSSDEEEEGGFRIDVNEMNMDNNGELNFFREQFNDKLRRRLEFEEMMKRGAITTQNSEKKKEEKKEEKEEFPVQDEDNEIEKEEEEEEIGEKDGVAIAVKLASLKDTLRGTGYGLERHEIDRLREEDEREEEERRRIEEVVEDKSSLNELDEMMGEEEEGEEDEKKVNEVNEMSTFEVIEIPTSTQTPKKKGKGKKEKLKKLKSVKKKQKYTFGKGEKRDFNILKVHTFAQKEVDEKYHNTDYALRRKIKTSSISLKCPRFPSSNVHSFNILHHTSLIGTLEDRQTKFKFQDRIEKNLELDELRRDKPNLEVTPEFIDFGRVRLPKRSEEEKEMMIQKHAKVENYEVPKTFVSKKKVCKIVNLGSMLARFRVKMDHSNIKSKEKEFKITYKKGAVAPGMSVPITVCWRFSETGEFQNELVIRTEGHFIKIPLRATVV